MKSWLEKNIEMYSAHNEGKSVIAERFIKTLKNEIAERFIKTLKNKIYKYMTSISKNIYIGKFNDTADKYNNTYHSTIKMKSVDVTPSTYIDSSKEINDEVPNLKLVILLEYQNIKTFLQNAMFQVGLKKFL